MKNLFLIVLSLTVLLPATSHAANLNGKTVYADVNGLVCDFCAQSLKKVFGKKEAVEKINVNLDDKVITITFKEGQSLSHEEIEKVIVDSGYDLVGIRETQDE